MGQHFKETGNWYVSALGGNDTTGDGTPHRPFKTVNKAVLSAVADGTANQAIIIGTGIYNEELDKSNASIVLALIGDGKVIFDGTGVTYGTDTAWTNSTVFNITFVNYANFVATNNGQNFNLWTKCNFINILEFWPNNQANAYTYVRNFQDCKFVNCAHSASPYIRGAQFTNCHFHDSALMSSNGNYSGNTYLTKYMNCIFTTSNTTGLFPILSGTFVGAEKIKNCGFGENTSFYGLMKNEANNSVYVGLVNVGERITTELLNTGSAGFFHRLGGGNYTFSASFNSNISGSSDLSPINQTLDMNNAPLYARSLVAPLTGPGGIQPVTAYGYDSSSTNPLHPMGGATWQNITTSSLGGFQIDGSGTGSITTAVIDQGGTKAINNIDIGFTSNALNAAAPSTHPSGALNHNPTRYQFEMKYGNASDLSSGTYKIFEFGAPCTTIGGLTGSGDQNFNTGSGANPSQVSARYLQLKITLRTDMSGSV